MTEIHCQWELPRFYRVQTETGECLFSSRMATFVDQCHHYACGILGVDPCCDGAWTTCSVPSRRVRRATRIQVGTSFVDVMPPCHAYYPVPRKHYSFVGGYAPASDYGNLRNMQKEVRCYQTVYPENAHLLKINRIAQAKTNIANRRARSNGISGALLVAFVAGCTFGFLGVAAAALPLLVIGAWMALTTGAALLFKWGFAPENQAKDQKDAETIRGSVNQLRRETQPQWHAGHVAVRPQSAPTQNQAEQIPVGVPLAEGEPIPNERVQGQPVK